MTDHFALLNEPRRPWLEVSALKAKFLQLSSEFHPDRVPAASAAEKEEAGRRFAELNAAYNILREPKERLLHLLELETGERPKDVQRIPPGTMDLFVEIGQTCREVDSFLAGRSKVTSPLLKVQLFARGQEWTEQLLALQQKVNAKREALAAELQAMNPDWEVAGRLTGEQRKSALALERLEPLYRVFSYVARWTEQLQERVVQLSF